MMEANVVKQLASMLQRKIPSASYRSVEINILIDHSKMDFLFSTHHFHVCITLNFFLFFNDLWKKVVNFHQFEDKAMLLQASNERQMR